MSNLIEFEDSQIKVLKSLLCNENERLSKLYKDATDHSVKHEFLKKINELVDIESQFYLGWYNGVDE